MGKDVRCPNCGSRNIESYGTKLIEFGKWRRGAKEYLCKECEKRFWIQTAD